MSISPPSQLLDSTDCYPAPYRQLERWKEYLGGRDHPAWLKYEYYAPADRGQQPFIMPLRDAAKYVEKAKQRNIPEELERLEVGRVYCMSDGVKFAIFAPWHALISEPAHPARRRSCGAQAVRYPENPSEIKYVGW